MALFQGDERSSGERRHFYRFGPQSMIPKGRLVLEGWDIPVKVLDESTEGFGVVADGVTPLEVGCILLLETDSGWAEVQVMNVVRREAKSHADSSICSGTETRMGLRRLRDLPPWEFASESRWQVAWLELKILATSMRPLAWIGAGAAILLFAATLATAVYAWRSQHPLASCLVVHESPSGRDKASGRHPVLKLEVARDPARPAPQPSTSPESLQPVLPQIQVRSVSSRPVQETAATSEPRSQRNTSSAAGDLLTDVSDTAPADSPPAEGSFPWAIPQDVILQSSPDILLKPAIAAALDLSREQLEQLHRLLEHWEAKPHAANGSSTTDHAVSAPTPIASLQSENAAELVRQTLAILSPEQRQHWVRVASDLGRPKTSSDRSGPVKPAAKPVEK